MKHFIVIFILILTIMCSSCSVVVFPEKQTVISVISFWVFTIIGCAILFWCWCMFKENAEIFHPDYNEDARYDFISVLNVCILAGLVCLCLG